MSIVSQLEVVIGGDVKNLSSSLGDADRQVDGFAGRVSKTMTNVGKTLTMGVTLPLVGVGIAAAKMAIDWESQFAGVRKTVDATEEEFTKLENDLRNLATATDSPVAGLENAHEVLAGIAEIAGQLGVDKEHIIEFTETIAQLGMATNLTGEEAALSLAQFANITGMDMGNIDRLGATIVDLGNNLATTEADIVAFAQRLAGAGTLAGLSEAEILALGGAMASMGLNAEAGGTAMTQVLNEMASAAASFSTGVIDSGAAVAKAEDTLVEAIDGRASAVKNLEKAYGKLGAAGTDVERQAAQIEVDRLTASIARYDRQIGDSQGNIEKWASTTEVQFSNASKELRLFADTAGISVEEFSTLWETDAEKAIVAFVEGLGKLDQAAQLDVLEQLNLSGIRVQDTLRRLAGNSELLKESFERAGIAWEDNTALTDEAQKRFETTSAQLNLLFNNVRDVGIVLGQIFLPAINEAISLVVPLLQEITNLNPDVLNMGVGFLVAAAAAGPLLTVLGALISPAGLVAGAFAVAAIGIPLFVGKLREAFPAVDEFFNNIESSLTEIGGVSGIAEALSLAITGDLQGFAVLPGEIYLSIVTFRNNLISKVNELMGIPSAFVGKISGIGEAFRIGITQDFTAGMITPDQAKIVNAISGVRTSIITAINTDFSGITIDLTQIDTWANDNVNAILETVTTVVGIVLGGPVGMAIGAAKLIAGAIESDFLGIKTFLDNSGITTAVETALSSLKTDIENILASVFGGEASGGDDASMLLLGPVMGGGEEMSGPLQRFTDRLAVGFEVLKTTVAGIWSDIGPGLADLGDGIKGFVDNLTGTETEGLLDVVTFIAGGIGAIGLAIAQVGGFLAGTVLSSLGAALPDLGTALSRFISAISLIGEGDIGGALTKLGEGLGSIGSAVINFSTTAADGVIEKIEEVAGVELPSVDEGMAAWVGAFETAAQTVAIVLDNVKREVEKILLEIGSSLTQAGLDMANNPLVQMSPQANMINQAVEPAKAGLAAAQERLGNIDTAKTFEEELYKVNQMSDIDLVNLVFPEDMSGVAAEGSERMRILIEQIMGKLIAEQDWTNLGAMIPFAEAFGFDMTGLTEKINGLLDEAIMMGDEEAFNALLPTAMMLDIDLGMLEVQMQESVADAAAAREYEGTVDVRLTMNVTVDGNPIKDAVQAAAKASGVTVSAGGGAKPFHSGGTFYHPDGEGLAFLKSGETVRTVAQEKAVQRSRGGGGGGDTYIVNSYGQSAYGLVNQVKRAQRDMGV